MVFSLAALSIGADELPVTADPDFSLSTNGFEACSLGISWVTAGLAAGVALSFVVTRLSELVVVFVFILPFTSVLPAVDSGLSDFRTASLSGWPGSLLACRFP